MKKRVSSCFPSIFVMFLVLIVAAALVLEVGSKLGVLLMATPSTAGCRLVVQVQPNGSLVFIDEKLNGKTPYQTELRAGEHIVRVEQEGYLPYESIIVAKTGQTIQLTQALALRPVAEIVAEGADYPHWAADGSLLYFAIDTGEIRAHPSGKVLGGPLYGRVNSLAYSPSGTFAAVVLEQAEIPDVLLLDLTRGQSEPVGLGFCPITWPDEMEIATLCWDQSSAPGAVSPAVVYRGPAASLPLKSQALADFSRAIPANWMGYSGDGKWLAILSGSQLSLWKLDQAAAAFASTVEQVQAASWDPSDPARLVVLDMDNNLLVLSPSKSADTRLLAGPAGPPLAWMPDGRVLYTLYSPTDGGSALWSVDVTGGARQLLLDASLMRGKVERLALSPDGKWLAYSTSFHYLYRVQLGNN
jgi:hypothetical protein